MGTDPEAVTDFDWLGSAVSDTPSDSNVADIHRSFRVPETPGTPFASYVVDLHAFFRVPGDPASVFRRLHQPPARRSEVG